MQVSRRFLARAIVLPGGSCSDPTPKRVACIVFLIKEPINNFLIELDVTAFPLHLIGFGIWLVYFS